MKEDAEVIAIDVELPADLVLVAFLEEEPGQDLAILFGFRF